MKRRTFLQTAAAFAGGAILSSDAQTADQISAAKLPRWRGFNLMEKFTLRHNAPYVERDFEWMADWGFDFARLPTDYRCWTDAQDPKKLDESILKHFDQAIEYGKQYGVHINLNLHRGPGYCVNPPKEELDLWTDERALELFCFQWQNFAERFKGIPNSQLSFDLLNEPPRIEEEIYAKVMRATVEAIRSADPERLIVVDGLEWGRKPVLSLADLNIGQSTRGYDPMYISHYKASWVSGTDSDELPTWPLKRGESVYDQARLREERIKPWKEAESKGIGVHVGEWGCYNKTPHDVALAWMKDFLELWQEEGWGWAMWNLRGSFGVVDSGRNDVQYEEFQGHKLDRKLLELIRAY